MKNLTLLPLFLSLISFGQHLNFNIDAIQQNTLSFKVDKSIETDIIIHYGKTEALELGAIEGLTIENLDAATSYYVKVGLLGKSNTESEIKLFSTSSKSSGAIKVYFNQSVNNAASNIADAITANVKDTIIAYIDRAENTLDIANYNTGSLDIVNAINAAKSRGVAVRYIAADNTGTNNDELSSLSSTIPMIQRPNDGEVMHNKFLIIDVGDFQKAKVVTGSVNHTENSCLEDYNNLVIIEDQSLANAYKTEFEEMWGSTTMTPNLTLAKFGADKIDNTPHNFNIGGIPVELYFSPSDNVTAHIETAVRSANTDMQFVMLTFINNDLGDAVIDMHNTGVNIVGIIENVFYFGSEYNGILSAGVEVYSHAGESNILHHKYGIVDANDVASDPLVITGSHNWTNSAEEDYDENTLIIHDAVIANMYYEEFMARYQDVAGVSVKVNENSAFSTSIYPNPTIGNFTIESDAKISNITILDTQGKTVANFNGNKMNINLQYLPKGVYHIKIDFQNDISFIEKIVLI